MRALRPMTVEERDFAEQEHQLVIEFLHRRRLPMDDFYDVVIFGYLSAVQQYFRDPPSNVAFKAMAFWAMKDAVLRDREYNTRAKRAGFTVGLDKAADALTDTRQDTQRRIEDKTLLLSHQPQSVRFNFFTGRYYVDDVYGVQGEGTHARSEYPSKSTVFERYFVPKS